MIALKWLKVRGFRAYTEEKEFHFDNPAVLLFGENHLGKSSTLNAIEWCIFGNECIGKETGIRERIDWEIPNRNVERANVSVEVKLEDEGTGDKFTVSRKWLSPRKDEVKLVFGDGRALRGQEAREKLAQLLKVSFRDFLTTVYQHQEAIRAVLTQEPKERNDAIDRLLGLSDYRNILTGVKRAGLTTSQKGMGDKFESFSREVDVALRTMERDLKDSREEAVEKGLKEEQLCAGGALDIATQVKERLEKFASEVRLWSSGLEVGEQCKDLREFREVAKGEIKRFRAEMPDAKEQGELFKTRTEIIALKEKYKEKEKSWHNAKSSFDSREKESGKLEGEQREFQKKMKEKEKELSKASAKGSVIAKALYFLGLEGVAKTVCPVCGSEKPDLLYKLQAEWMEKYENLLGTIQGELNVFNNRLEEINSWFVEYESVKKSFRDASNSLVKVKGEIGEALRRKISQRDDPGVILNNVLVETNERLGKLAEVVKGKQRILDGIEGFLEKMELVVKILDHEEKKRVVEEIQESSEYRRMEQLRDEMAVFVDDVERIKEAISEASREAAEEKVSAAERVIDNCFRRIANNPCVTRIQFLVSVDSRTGLNSYLFKDQNGKDITPVLSQGDLNAMALSLFLGMACSGGTDQAFGFVILDDPSQSLGSQHKEKLVEVLDEVLDERMVILSSMDKELQELVLSKVSKAKTKYIFSNWTPEGGPSVEEK